MSIRTVSTYSYPKHSTSSTAAAVVVISLLAAGTGSVFDIEQAQKWWGLVKSRVSFSLSAPAEAVPQFAQIDMRTPVDHIENIREVLTPAMSDLAATFGVSRQAIYKWISKDSEPESDTLTKIVNLSKAADIFKGAGIERAGSMLKMKAFDGQSLLSLVQTGSMEIAHVHKLVKEARVMEEAYASSRLRNSKAPSTADWQGYISIPGSSERV